MLYCRSEQLSISVLVDSKRTAPCKAVCTYIQYIQLSHSMGSRSPSMHVQFVGPDVVSERVAFEPLTDTCTPKTKEVVCNTLYIQNSNFIR